MWRTSAPTDTRASLIFEFDGIVPAEEGTGLLLGEFEMNGALCLQFDDGTIAWPAYNPRPTTGRDPTL